MFDKTEARALLDGIGSRTGRTLTFMEVCGTHTMAAARAGLHSLLPDTVRLISGPGCPVCVTPVGYIDHALVLADRPEVTITSFGDLMRVPGSKRDPRDRTPSSLLSSRARGADVRVVYSPVDALDLARTHPNREVVFLGVGFETTTPAIAAAILRAHHLGLRNFSVLSANKTIPEAMEALAASDDLALDGFLCPGHVSVVLGPEAYAGLAERCGVPCVIGGFEPIEMIRGIDALARQVAERRAEVENCYPGAVRPGGNARAREVAARVYQPADSTWRGVGTIPGSGLEIREEFRCFDAERRFSVSIPTPEEPRGCRCGEVLRGVLDPAECGLFGRRCTPETPEGACMVSSEGSCAARYAYR